MTFLCVVINCNWSVMNVFVECVWVDYLYLNVFSDLIMTTCQSRKSNNQLVLWNWLLIVLSKANKENDTSPSTRAVSLLFCLEALKTPKSRLSFIDLKLLTFQFGLQNFWYSRLVPLDRAKIFCKDEVEITWNKSFLPENQHPAFSLSI